MIDMKRLWFSSIIGTSISLIGFGLATKNLNLIDLGLQVVSGLGLGLSIAYNFGWY